MLILCLSRKKEKYSTRTSPFSLKCNWKDVQLTAIKPIFYLYLDEEHCVPSQSFKDSILTNEVQNITGTPVYKDLSKFTNETANEFPYIEAIEHTPTIIIEYPNVENEEQKSKIINENGINYGGNKYLIIISNLSRFTPNEGEIGPSLQQKRNEFINFISNKIII